MSKTSSMRRRKLAIYNSYYKAADVPKDFCVYCGDRATTLDHVPCLDAVYCLGRDFFEERKVSLQLFPCCEECNVMLGNMFIHTVHERAKYVFVKINRKYKKFLTTPLFSSDEIDEFKQGLLKDMLINTRTIQLLIRRRHKFMRDRFNFL